MKPEKINELIPVIHAEEKRRGGWDGLPETRCVDTDNAITCYNYLCVGAGGCAFDKKNEPQIENCTSYNAYLATKLDRITEALVDAMRAKREGRRVTEHAIRWYNGTMPDRDEYERDALHTYEHRLTLALYRVLDLMGFYCDEFNMGDMRVFCGCDSHGAMRGAIYRISTAFHSLESGEEFDFRPTVMLFIRIAELDNIDIEWHLDALRKYQGGE